MRVLDYLENYDIPSGFHLTADQEEQLTADLKEIVLALIPLLELRLRPLRNAPGAGELQTKLEDD